MLKNSKAFGSYSSDNIEEARIFYSQTLGLEVNTSPMGVLELLVSANPVIIYPKPDHQPAVFTVLNFPVGDIDEAVGELIRRGVKMEFYEGFEQDELGIFRGKSHGEGPNIAWFKDPAGNILSVLEE